MNVTGHRSLASFLIALFSIARATVGIVLLLTVGVIAFALFADVRGLDMTVIPPSFGVDSPEHSNWRLTIPVSVTIDDGKVAAASLAIGGGQIQDLHGSVTFPIHRGPFFVVNSLLLILGMLVAFWVLSQLLGVLRSVRIGQPFAPSNADRVRRIAWCVIGAEFARTAIVYFESSYAAEHFAAEGLRFAARPDFSLAAILEGFIILVIAEVFRAGTRLDEEQSLTV